VPAGVVDVTGAISQCPTSVVVSTGAIGVSTHWHPRAGVQPDETLIGLHTVYRPTGIVYVAGAISQCPSSLTGSTVLSLIDFHSQVPYKLEHLS